MKNEMLGCSDVKDEVSALAKELKKLNFHPDYIVSVSRGGMVPARLLAARVNIKRMLYFGIDYSDDRKEINLYSTPNPMPENKKILIVDDCVCSGRKIKKVLDLCEKAGNECKTMSVFILEKTPIHPDIYLEIVDRHPRFPWDRKEEIENC